MSALHITNGGCAAGTLRAFLTDPVHVTCDVLHDGPAPAVDDDAWYDTRARFLTDGFGAHYEETRASLAAFDRMVADAPPDQEIVLWFEHDLFDQLLLIRTLDVMVRLKAMATNVSLICIGEFPGVERFVGLGQLTAEQLASLYPARQPVSSEQFALASEAWRAFRADDPRELLALMVRLKLDEESSVRLTASAKATASLAEARQHPGERRRKADTTSDPNASPAASGLSRTSEAPLPFLHGAIHRLFEEYPSTKNGLSRSADAVLRELESGRLDGMALFRATQWAEPRPFMGDSGLFDIVHRLAAARKPLVTIDPAASPQDLRASTIELTDAGREVLAGRQDAVALNGIDEWRGGVHLLGDNQSPWRWDARAETLVQ